MKKTFGFICIAVLMVSTVFPKYKIRLPPKELEVEIKTVLPLTDLTVQVTNELFLGLHPEIAVQCKEGTEIPFKYIGNYNLFSVHFTPNLSIKLEKDVYLRFIRLNPLKPKSLKTYISYDLKEWKQLRKNELNGHQDANFGWNKDKSAVLLETTLKPPVILDEKEKI